MIFAPITSNLSPVCTLPTVAKASTMQDVSSKPEVVGFIPRQDIYTQLSHLLLSIVKLMKPLKHTI